MGMGHDSSSAHELRRASQKGDLKAVKYLTEEKRLNPLQEDEDGRNAIYCAAKGGQLAVLKYFIEDQGHNPASAGSGSRAGWTPLHVAALYDHLELVRYLIAEQQVDPMCQTERGDTPLHQACRDDNNMDVIVYLVNAMSQHLPLKDVVSCRGKDGHAPLHTAALYGQLKIIKYFITELNCDPSIVITGEHHGRTTKCGGRITLHGAAQRGHLHVVKFLVEDQHCDPSHCDYEKVTPLHKAAQHGHLAVVQYLTLEQHCDPLCTNIWNNTPLHAAAIRGHLEVVRFMIETLHCPPDVRGQHNMTPLEQARSQGHHHFVKYLESLHPQLK
jgi:ankyrin repeat protein